MDGQRPRDRLGELVAMARGEPAPELHIERLEQRLRAEYEAARARGELRAKRAAHGRAGRALPWLAAAALLALGIGLSRQWTQLPNQPARSSTPTAVPTVLDGAALAPGARVTAGADQVLRVEHAGRARWELAAGSQAHLVNAGAGVLCVELEQGTLSAMVVPGPAESFMVRARGTEIAVHGTRFDVHLDDARVVVEVSQGEVEVRPLERNRRARLTAGMSAGFIEGVPEPEASRAAALAAPAPGDPVYESSPAPVESSARKPVLPGAAHAPPRVGRVPSASADSAVAAPAPAPSADVTRAVADAAIARVTDHIESCFRRHTLGRGPVSIEASTRVVLEVQPNGLILGVSLDPPLAPQVETCVATELATVNLGASEAGYRVRREIRLSL